MTAPPAASGYTFTNPVSIVAAAVAVVGSLLDWFDFFGATSNAFDVAAPFLVDRQTTASDTVTVGLLVVLLAAAAAVVCLVPPFAARPAVLRGLGVALLAISAAFVFQMAATASDIGLSFGDVIGIGPVVTGLGGAALLIAK